MVRLPAPAAKPTIYFIGVATGKSSIMYIFPSWSKALGIDACIKGIDIDMHAPDAEYRRVVQFINDDPLSMGAFVTKHNIDIFNACRDMFGYLDPYSLMFGELNSISKADGVLRGHAKDLVSSGLALDAFIPCGHWQKYKGAQACVLGAAGSAFAISASLANEKHGASIPSRIHLTNRSAPRLAEAVRVLSTLRVPMSFHLCTQPGLDDVIVESLPEGSLVVNATGLGKDRPGSPLTDRCRFPINGLVWELNYRGTLEFMRQAEKQKQERRLLVEDGWAYFIHSWTQVIAEVFGTDISGERLSLCERLARG